VLRTLREAGHYVTKLPKTDQAKPHWQTAARELMMAAERGGILMLADRDAPGASRKARQYGGRRQPKNTKLSADFPLACALRLPETSDQTGRDVTGDA
jgi:hypothetical protein